MNGTRICTGIKKHKGSYPITVTNNFCCDPTKWLRRTIIKLVTHEYFELFSMLLVSINSILLALEEPRTHDLYFTKTKQTFSDMIAVFLIVEVILRIISQGFYSCSHSNSYMNDGFNVLDFFLAGSVIVFWIILDADAYNNDHSQKH